MDARVLSKLILAGGILFFIFFCDVLARGGAAARNDASSIVLERGRMDLSGNGWHLWLDRDAKWQNDSVF